MDDELGENHGNTFVRYHREFAFTAESRDSYARFHASARAWLPGRPHTRRDPKGGFVLNNRRNDAHPGEPIAGYRVPCGFELSRRTRASEVAFFPFPPILRVPSRTNTHTHTHTHTHIRKSPNIAESRIRRMSRGLSSLVSAEIMPACLRKALGIYQNKARMCFRDQRCFQDQWRDISRDSSRFNPG